MLKMSYNLNYSTNQQLHYLDTLMMNQPSSILPRRLPVWIFLAINLASAPTIASPLNQSDAGVVFANSLTGSNQEVNAIANRTSSQLSTTDSVPLGSSFAKVGIIVSNHDVSTGKKFMTPQVRGVMAAPNESEIRAKVLRVEQSTEFADKWYLELEILASKTIAGGTFAGVGDRVKAFTIASRPNFSENQIITAQAEFLGDAQGGLFRLTNIQQ